MFIIYLKRTNYYKNKNVVSFIVGVLNIYSTGPNSPNYFILAYI